MLSEEFVEQDEELPLPAKSTFVLLLGIRGSFFSKVLPAFRHDGLGGRALDRDGGGVGVAGLRLRHRLGHRVQEVDEPGLPVRRLARFHFSVLLRDFARLRWGDERAQILVVFLKEVILLRCLSN